MCRLLLFIALVGFPAWANASSVVPMQMQTLADHAGQVILGRVASMQSYWTANPRRIETKIVFNGVEYLKGRLASSGQTFELIVPGGTVGNMQMQISDTPRFHVGEKYLLFLLPSYKTFPVVGLGQGCFRVRPDAAGIERMYHGTAQPVTGINADGFVRVAMPQPSMISPRLVASTNARLTPPSKQSTKVETAMTCQEFCTLLRPILRASRNHRLTQPAGHRVLVRYQSVSLKQSVLDRSKEAGRGQSNINGNQPRSKESSHRTNRPPAPNSSPSEQASDSASEEHP